MLMANTPVAWSTSGAVKLRKVKVGGCVLGVMMPCSTLTTGSWLLLPSTAVMNTCRQAGQVCRSISGAARSTLSAGHTCGCDLAVILSAVCCNCEYPNTKGNSADRTVVMSIGLTNSAFYTSLLWVVMLCLATWIKDQQNLYTWKSWLAPANQKSSP